MKLVSVMLCLSQQQSASVISKLLLPLVVSGLNLLLPFVFRIIASLESYEKPRTSLKISLTRYTVLSLCFKVEKTNYKHIILQKQGTFSEDKGLNTLVILRLRNISKLYLSGLLEIRLTFNLNSKHA